MKPIPLDHSVSLFISSFFMSGFFAAKTLQLRLGPGLVENGFQLGSLHNIALDLKLARHKQALGLGLAHNKLAKVFVGETEFH